MIRVRIRFGLAIAIALSTACGPSVEAQKAAQEGNLFADFQSKMARQPDYMADMKIVLLKNVVVQRIARKGGKVRFEFSPFDDAALQVNEAARNYKIIFIAQPDQPWTALDPQEKSYAQLPDNLKTPAPDMQEIYRQVMGSKDEGKIVVDSLGFETVDGHETEKMRVRFKGEKGEMFFYIAKDLSNLLVKMETSDIYEGRPAVKDEKMSYSLSNISLNVPDDSFQVPKGYKSVSFDSLMSTVRRNAGLSF
jgi:hypothetical protein